MSSGRHALCLDVLLVVLPWGVVWAQGWYPKHSTNADTPSFVRCFWRELACLSESPFFYCECCFRHCKDDMAYETWSEVSLLKPSACGYGSENAPKLINPATLLTPVTVSIIRSNVILYCITWKYCIVLYCIISYCTISYFEIVW